MTTPESIDRMVDRETGVIIEGRYFEHRPPSYWVQSGVGAIEFTEEGLKALRLMLDEYYDENLGSKVKLFMKKWGVHVLLLVWIIVFPIAMSL